MAQDELPTDKGKGKEPVQEEKTNGANGAKDATEQTTVDGKKPDIELAAGACHGRLRKE